MGMVQVTVNYRDAVSGETHQVKTHAASMVAALELALQWAFAADAGVLVPQPYTVVIEG